MSLTKSVHVTIQQIKNFWDRPAVKMKRNHHCYEKLKILYNELSDLKKINKPSTRKERFINDLFDVFDISHTDLFKLIEESEKNVFLSQSIDDIKKSLTYLRLTRRVHTLRETDFRRHWRVDFWYLKMKPSVPNSIS